MLGGATGRAVGAAVALILGPLVTRAGGAVSCDVADNLCRGNPCVIRRVEVESPCVVDFGTRTLVIGGTLRVPNGGELSLTAGAIEVRRAIVGRHVRPSGGKGAHIALTSAGNLVVRWRIDASARSTPGSITLRAARDIRLFGPIRAASNGANATAAGGTIVMDAGGKIEAVGRARIRAEGGVATAGGQVSLSGARGVSLDNRIGADGSVGGSIGIFSMSGDVTVSQRMGVTGTLGAGGGVSIASQSGRLVTLENLEAGGMTAGGSVLLLGGAGVVTFGALRARSEVQSGPGGVVLVASDRDIVTNEALYADGASGGQISIVSRLGAVRTIAPLLASGRWSAGGSVGVGSGAGMLIDSMINADGRSDGGAIALHGSDVRLTNRGDLFARGTGGGTISISGGMVTVEDGARVLVDGAAPGGSISLEATEGDLTLSGHFQARGHAGGRIEAAAAGTVRAGGEFAARGNGCIALNGETVDVSGGEFDVPVVDMCR